MLHVKQTLQPHQSRDEEGAVALCGRVTALMASKAGAAACVAYMQAC